MITLYQFGNSVCAQKVRIPYSRRVSNGSRAR